MEFNLIEMKGIILKLDWITYYQKHISNPSFINFIKISRFQIKTLYLGQRNFTIFQLIDTH